MEDAKADDADLVDVGAGAGAPSDAPSDAPADAALAASGGADAPPAGAGGASPAGGAPARAPPALPSRHLTPLVAAARAGDGAEVARLLAAGADPRAVCLAAPSLPRRHESPAYETHALFEAVRARAAGAARALLADARTDPNQPATAVRASALGDAAARGDAEFVALLLADARIDAGAPAGGRVAAHGALLAAMAGSVPALAAFARAGALPRALEPALARTAAANARPAALAFLQGYFVDAARWATLPPLEAAVAVRRAAARTRAADADGLLDVRGLDAVLAALGVTLSAEEADDAFAALNAAGDGRVDVDALTAWLLGDTAWRDALAASAGAGAAGFAGVTLGGGGVEGRGAGGE